MKGSSLRSTRHVTSPSSLPCLCIAPFSSSPPVGWWLQPRPSPAPPPGALALPPLPARRSGSCPEGARAAGDGRGPGKGAVPGWPDCPPKQHVPAAGAGGSESENGSAREGGAKGEEEKEEEEVELGWG
jgi:hypothetical protein